MNAPGSCSIVTTTARASRIPPSAVILVAVVLGCGGGTGGGTGIAGSGSGGGAGTGAAVRRARAEQAEQPALADWASVRSRVRPDGTAVAAAA